MIEKTGLVILVSALPAIELKGAIPLGLSLGLNPLFTLFVAILFNSLIFFPVFFGLKIFHENLFSKISFLNKYLEKIRKRGEPYVKKYGFLGLTLLISTSLPGTGVYTGSFLSWILGLDWKRAFLAITLGLIVSGIIVLSLSLGILNAIKLLV